MGKNVMKMLKPSPKRGKNAFDLSHRHVLGANFGELLPITCIETVPEDFIEINCADLLRAMPMVTSPFMRAKQHIDFWFVPYTDMWHQFNSFITDKDQPQSAALKGSDYCPHFRLRDMVAVCNGSTTSTFTDVVGRSFQDGARRLFNLLGYGNAYQLNSSATLPDVNPWRLAAYNYIWYNEYRQQYYDDGTRYTAGNPSTLFNFDDVPCTSYAEADIENYTGGILGRLASMMQMRYRCWKKDLYTGILPSSQFGSVSAVNVNFGVNTNAQRYLMVGPTYDSVKVSNTFTSGSTTNPDAASGNYNPSIDVLSLRQAQAVQIWRENALRSGNRVNDNMRGHFGSYPSYQRDHRPTYIGSYDAPLNISDINSTAQIGSAGNQQLGDVAGKGLSSLDSRILKFQTNDFGVIMGIFSLLPEAEYNATGIERTNQLLDRFDYFSFESENIGLEVVSSQNFRATPVSAGFNFGYAPRYFGYKTKLDKCFDAFQTGGALQIWCSPKFDVDQALSTMTSGTIPIQTLYVNPAIFDVNFVADAATLGCQFLCDFFFDVEAVRAMTVLGLPTY